MDGGGPGATLERRRNMRRRERRRRRVFDYESLGNAGLNREHFHLEGLERRGVGEEGRRGGREGRSKQGEERRGVLF